MISAIRFDDRGIHYRNRYVATENYRDETRAGRIVNRGFGKMRPGGMLANAFRQPANVSNTSVVMQGDRLLSLWEGGPPFALDPATLDTRGVETFGGTVKAFSAHPKIDPDTGELFNFGIDYGARTTLTPYRIDKGVVTRLPPVTLPYRGHEPRFRADATTTWCSASGRSSCRCAPFLLGLKSFDGALHWDGGMPTLILLVPRDGSGKPRIIETDAFFQFHFANGFEEDGALVLDLARYPDYHTIGQALRDYWRSTWPSRGHGGPHPACGSISATGKVESRTYDSGTANEFPCINPAYVGKRQRYAYIACNPRRPEDRPAAAARQGRSRDRRRCAARFRSGRLSRRAFVHRHRSAAGRRMTAWWSPWCSTPRASAPTSSASTRATSRREPLFVAPLKHHVPFSLHGTFKPASPGPG